MIIYKYPVVDGSFPTIPGEIVHVGLDANKLLCMWIMGKKNEPTVYRSFSIIGTGHEFPEKWTHVHTFADPPFIWHLMEEQRDQ